MADTTKKTKVTKAKKAPQDKPAAKTAKAKTAKKSGGSKRAPLAPRTYFAKAHEVSPKWKLIDAEGQTLGRLCSQIAHTLMGKDDPAYTRHAATGSFVVVVNASKVKLTGRKWQQKVYQWYTGYSGGIKEMTAEKVLTKHPDRLIEWGVHGMLPRGHVGSKWRKRLRVFAGAEHNHAAQKPEPMTVSR